MAKLNQSEMTPERLADLEAAYAVSPRLAVRELDAMGLLDSQGRLYAARARAARLRALDLTAGHLPSLLAFTPTPQAR